MNESLKFSPRKDTSSLGFLLGSLFDTSLNHSFSIKTSRIL